jgi:microsomal dipeptidase-like Zn-dependent dipeptidase
MVEANRHWMTIVRRPEDAWSALNSNKLVVILGIEVDSIAGPDMRWDGQLAIEDVDAIVEGWWNKGVRLLHPVHLADNALGGTAVYNDYFNFLNHYLIKKHARRQGTSWFLQVDDAAEQADTEDIRFKLGSPWAYSLAYDWRGRYRPSYPDAARQSGHVNRRGLSEAGEAFLLSMMRRGMLIDVEHMSNRTLHDALRIAQRFRYPLFSTHTAIRSLAVTPPKDGSFTDGCAHEAMRSDEDLMAIQELGGMLGIGCHLGLTKGLDVDASTSWTRAYQYAVHKLGFTSVGIGTDMNGFAQAPGPRFGGNPLSPSPHWKRDPIRAIDYGSDTIPLSSKVLDQAALGRRSFDFNFDGLAHYGLLPDFTVDVALSLGYRSPLTTQREMTPFFTSANAVVAAWSTCVTQSRAPGLQEVRRLPRVEESRASP